MADDSAPLVTLQSKDNRTFQVRSMCAGKYGRLGIRSIAVDTWRAGWMRMWRVRGSGSVVLQCGDVGAFGAVEEVDAGGFGRNVVL